MRGTASLGAALVLAAAGFGAAGAERTAGTPSPASGGGAAVATIEVGGSPSSIVATAGMVWVSLGLGGVAGIDPATNEVVEKIRPGGAVIDLAAGFGALWAVDVFGDRLLRLDSRTGRVTRVVRVAEMPSGVAVGKGLVWVTSQLGSTVSGVDPRTGRVLKHVRFAYGELWPGGVAVTRAGVWVITGGGNELTLVDPERMAIVRRMPAPGARALAVTGGTLWVGLAREAFVLRVGSDGIERVQTAGYLADGYGPPLAGGSRLVLAAAGRVALVDPREGSVTEVLRLPEGHRASAVAITRDAWIADETAGVVVRRRVPRPVGRLLAGVQAKRAAPSAAAELARYRAAARRLAPSVRRATRIVREVERRYRLPNGRHLAVAEVGTTLAVEALLLVEDGGTGMRQVTARNGVYFALCARPARRYCRLQPSASPGAALARRQALELATRTLLETPAALVVVSLPQSDRHTVLLVVERRPLAAEIDLRRLVRLLSRPGPEAVAAATVDRLTVDRLFVPAGLAAVGEARDALVAYRLRPPRGDAPRRGPGA